ncbi:MAG: hypothetical protein AB1478_01780 [Nitrospirota bacterium]
MRILILLFGLAVLSGCEPAVAETTTGIESNQILPDLPKFDLEVGTETTGTGTGVSSIIVDFKFQAEKAEIVAGEKISFLAEAIWSDGKTETVTPDFSCDTGTIEGGIFTTTKAGENIIIAKYRQFERGIIVNVLPAEPVQVKISMKEIPFGVKIDLNDYIKVVGVDRYNNKIDGLAYMFAAQTKNPSILSQVLPALTLSDGREFKPEYLRNGLLGEDGLLIFFDTSEYIGTVSLLNGVSETIVFTPKRTKISSEWIDKFMSIKIIDCIEIACWIFLQVEQEKEKMYQKELRQNFLLKPFLKEKK